MSKNLFQKALAGEILKTPPIWMMRQAGRYHSHYQSLKQKHSFMDLCLQPELATKVALGPVEDFDFDAAILFSDILFPLKALGMPLDYTDQGPKLGYELDLINVKKLKPWAEAAPEMHFQKEALQLTRRALPASKGLIGFVGGPWTLFVYALEGSHSGNLLKSKTSWSLWQEFSQVILNFLTENIRLQLEGGADVVMIFDTAAGELSPKVFSLRVQPVLANLIKKFPGKVGYYSKGTTLDHFNQEWKKLPLLGQGYDHRHQLTRILQSANSPASSAGFIQGNFDQGLLHLPESDFEIFLKEYLESFKSLSPEERKGWVCGLGHGILPKTPEKNVRSFIEIVRTSFS